MSFNFKHYTLTIKSASTRPYEITKLRKFANHTCIIRQAKRKICEPRYNGCPESNTSFSFQLVRLNDRGVEEREKGSLHSIGLQGHLIIRKSERTVESRASKIGSRCPLCTSTTHSNSENAFLPTTLIIQDENVDLLLN